jgi:hypothetical protein
MHGLAEHCEAAGIDHRNCNILAVGEGNDGKLHAELIAEFCMKRILGHFGYSWGVRGSFWGFVGTSIEALCAGIWRRGVAPTVTDSIHYCNAF